MDTSKGFIVFLAIVVVFISTSTSESVDDDSSYWTDGTLEKALANISIHEVPPKSEPARAWGNVLPSGEFTCSTAGSKEIPTSVHQLQPGDIKVIGAIGDSITAANGALSETVPAVLLQYRGVSWSIGGDESLPENPTLTNILRQYNPDLYGYSVGIARTKSRRAHFNVAVPGAKAIGLEGQAQNLVAKIKEDPEVDIESDWKIVTIFIGGNDLCQSCKKPEERTAENYVANIEKALKVLHDELPRTFVNLVGILNIASIRELRTPVCFALHLVECPCPLGSQLRLEKVVHLNKQYQAFLQSTIESGKYDNKEDFTVVYQPMFHNSDVPRLETGAPDLSFFAPDCFHFSAIGHAAGAIALWNNMIQPVGSKDTVWDYKSIRCPKLDFPYFYTNINSAPDYQTRYFNEKQSLERNFKKEPMLQDEHIFALPSEDHDSLSGGAVASITIGVLVVICCAVIVAVVIRQKRFFRNEYIKV
ncbi:phospholipase B1, membrane-associated-like [Anneissia japonica]|uniref:phospholipase B1, membrane-associated-like n=1 Tax=Anneissia japonica TaxID=1529436 RepID=UPI0014256201|nr:phospholipase B1, membrane-associated-like [Anneissia japonica]XP_033102858.1 phospholipase B1, membrane-associated-like [Anneissia japonica]